MEEKEEILKENIKEYYGLGIKAFQEKKFNSATTLFFKALAALADLFILRKEGRTPSSHKVRFRILEEKYPEIYSVLDKDFPFYQDSYTNKMDYETAKLLKNDVEKLKKNLKI